MKHFVPVCPLSLSLPSLTTHLPPPLQSKEEEGNLYCSSECYRSDSSKQSYDPVKADRYSQLESLLLTHNALSEHTSLLLKAATAQDASFFDEIERWIVTVEKTMARERQRGRASGSSLYRHPPPPSIPVSPPASLLKPAFPLTPPSAAPPTITRDVGVSQKAARPPIGMLFSSLLANRLVDLPPPLRRPAATAATAAAAQPADPVFPAPSGSDAYTGPGNKREGRHSPHPQPWAHYRP